MKYLGLLLSLLCTGVSNAQNADLYQISQAGRLGYIDSTGKVLIEPIYWSLDDFSEGLAAARKGEFYSYIDEKGNEVIPAQFDYVRPFHSGLALVHKPGATFYINTSGQKAFDIPYYKLEEFSEGRASVETQTGFMGCINTQGQLIIDTIYTYIGQFENGLAEVTGLILEPKRKGVFGRHYQAGVIDTLGNIVLPLGKYNEIRSIEKDYIIVLTHRESWDSTWASEKILYVSRADYRELPIEEAKREQLYEAFSTDTSFERKYDSRGIGKDYVDGKLVYLHKSGKVIWQEQPVQQLTNINAAYMDWNGYFACTEAFSEKYAGYCPKGIHQSDSFPKNVLSVVVKSWKKDTFDRYFNGIKAYIANTTNKSVRFNAQDMALDMKLQALDTDGVWKYIEYLMPSMCGNSYHKIELAPQKYWQFTLPVYEGSIATRLRLAVRYITPEDKTGRQEIEIYSNEFSGNINRSQLWLKPVCVPPGFVGICLD